MIRGISMEIVLSVDLSDHVSERNGAYIVIGDSNVPGVDIIIQNPKIQKSFSTPSFPEMDTSPYAVAIVGTLNTMNSELLSLQSEGGRFLPLSIANDDYRKQLIYEMTWDFVVVGRKAPTNQCDFFSMLFPPFSFSQGFKYLLRDWDVPTSSVNDYLLNFCCKHPVPNSPECFKIGHPSPENDNDCKGQHFVLESHMNTLESLRQSSTFVDQNEGYCRANYPGVEPYRYQLLHDHVYAQAVARVMRKPECERTAVPMEVDESPVVQVASRVPATVEEPQKYFSSFNHGQFQLCREHFTKPDELLQPWYTSWLSVSQESPRCVRTCKMCKKYFESGWRADQKHKSFIQKQGFFSKRNFENQEVVREHVKDNVHEEAMFFYVQLEQATTRSAQIQIEAAHKDLEKKRLRPTMNEVCIGYTELRARVSFMCHRQFMHGAHQLGEDVGFKHRIEKSLKQISVTLSLCFHKRLLQQLARENKFFSLICDGTTNRNIPHLSCLVQTLEDSQPVVYFWGLIVITVSESGHGMVEDLKIRISEDNDLVPGFEDYFKSHIIASVSVSASNMAGSKNSFYTHLSTYVGRNISLVKCGAHKLQRAIIHAVEFPTDEPAPVVADKDRHRYFKTFTHINNKFYTFYMSKGSKRFQKSMLRIYLYRRSITQGMVDPRWSTKCFARAFAAQAKGDNSPRSFFVKHVTVSL